MENNLNDEVKVRLFSEINMKMTLPKKKIFLQEIDRYICIKSFDEIEEGLCIFAGFDKNTGNYIIAEKGFQNLQIGIKLFLEHFEHFTYPEFYMYREMSKSQKKDLELKYFGK